MSTWHPNLPYVDATLACYRNAPRAFGPWHYVDSDCVEQALQEVFPRDCLATVKPRSFKGRRPVMLARSPWPNIPLPAFLELAFAAAVQELHAKHAARGAWAARFGKPWDDPAKLAYYHGLRTGFASLLRRAILAQAARPVAELEAESVLRSLAA